jgi:hypothetical protein
LELVISEFNGEIRQRILDNMNMEYLSTGKFVKDQRSISPKILSMLMLSNGAAGTAVSAKGAYQNNINYFNMVDQ